jgi:hypothetical protein
VLQVSRRLVLEWQALVCRTNALRRAFISVKGFYLQADLQGQPVTWLMPHSTSQVQLLPCVHVGDLPPCMHVGYLQASLQACSSPPGSTMHAAHSTPSTRL